MAVTVRARVPVVFLGVAVFLLAAGCRSAVDPRVVIDAQTAARVKTALVNDPAIGGRAIEVRVAGGVVTLSGRVQNQGEANRVLELAQAVSGVSGVRSNLQVGIETSPPVDQRPASVENEISELQPNPTWLAVGASLGWSGPRATALQTRVTASPLIRLGSGSGVGPAIGFDWFQADVRSRGAQGAILSRVHVKPIMVGASYTLAGERVSVSPSVVGGLAFNSLTITDTGAAAGVPVEVDNGVAWRPGVTVWYELSRRLALNVSGGHVMTRLRVTVLEGGRLVRRGERGDTTVVHAGLAYKVF